jgi:sugar lactone lactonase YvrE
MMALHQWKGVTARRAAMGGLSYTVVEGWEQLPAGIVHKDVVGLGVDSRDRLFMLTREAAQVLIYNRDGSFVGAWGEGFFTQRTHGLTIGPDDAVYIVDEGSQVVYKFTPEGELLLTIGTKGVASDTGYDGRALESIVRGGPPFNRPTNVAVAANGDLYVSDGYGNARVHHFSNDGTLLHSWGGPGTGKGEFNLPHSVWCHEDGRILVCDRENERVQIFTPEGDYIEEWTNMGRPGDLYVEPDGTVYIGEMNWFKDHYSLTGKLWTENRMACMTVRDEKGNVLSSFGGDLHGQDPCAAGNFTSPHGIWVDSHSDVYVGEVSQTSYEGTMYRPGCHSLQKFVRVR